MVYLPWTKKEISEYKAIKIQDEGLNIIYEVAGIPETQPDERVRHLSEQLKLLAIDHESIMHQAHKKGRPQALKFLEEVFIQSSQ